MGLRTFRRNGPGLAECESEAPWRRLWGDRRTHRSLDTRGPVSNVAAFWPQFGYRGQTHSTLRAARAGKSLATELGFEGHMKWAEAMTATGLHPYRSFASTITPLPSIIATWPSQTARSPGCSPPGRASPLHRTVRLRTAAGCRPTDRGRLVRCSCWSRCAACSTAEPQREIVRLVLGSSPTNSSMRAVSAGHGTSASNGSPCGGWADSKAGLRNDAPLHHHRRSC